MYGSSPLYDTLVVQRNNLHTKQGSSPVNESENEGDYDQMTFDPSHLTSRLAYFYSMLLKLQKQPYFKCRWRLSSSVQQTMIIFPGILHRGMEVSSLLF